MWLLMVWQPLNWWPDYLLSPLPLSIYNGVVGSVYPNKNSQFGKWNKGKQIFKAIVEYSWEIQWRFCSLWWRCFLIRLLILISGKGLPCSLPSMASPLWKVIPHPFSIMAMSKAEVGNVPFMGVWKQFASCWCKLGAHREGHAHTSLSIFPSKTAI